MNKNRFLLFLLTPLRLSDTITVRFSGGCCPDNDTNTFAAHDSRKAVTTRVRQSCGGGPGVQTRRPVMLPANFLMHFF